MSSIVKVGNVLYFKIGGSLERDEMDELEAVKVSFQNSGDENFVFDFSSLQNASSRACSLLAMIQAEARRRGRVFVLPPDKKMRDQLLNLQAIRDCEIYENRALVGMAIKRG